MNEEETAPALTYEKGVNGTSVIVAAKDKYFSEIEIISKYGQTYYYSGCELRFALDEAEAQGCHMYAIKKLTAKNRP